MDKNFYPDAQEQEQLGKLFAKKGFTNVAFPVLEEYVNLPVFHVDFDRTNSESLDPIEADVLPDFKGTKHIQATWLGAGRRYRVEYHK